MTHISLQDYYELLARKRRGRTVAQIETSAKRPSVRTMRVWVGGKLRNTKNMDRQNWKVVVGYTKAWVERTRQRLDTEIWAQGWAHVPTVPKRITFLARTGGTMDNVGLRVALAPAQDGLTRAGIIDDDADKAGHEFQYFQRIDRKLRGVLIVIQLLADAPTPLVPTWEEPLE
jgi:hypothetical protein